MKGLGTTRKVYFPERSIKQSANPLDKTLATLIPLIMFLCRSLKIISPADKSLFTILEWLAAQGYLQNNQQFVVKYDCSHTSLFVKVICSMRNLKTLLLRGNELTLGNLAHVFQSCPQIANLFLTNFKYTMFEMSEQLKNQLRSGFERLRCFAFVSSIDEFLWPVIQETMT